MMTEREHVRTDLANEQLEAALSLFLDQSSYAATITLAGAAEEVFGKALRRHGGQAVLEWKYNEIKTVFSLLYGRDLGKEAFFYGENRVRNALKHFDAEDNETFVTDLEEAACWMLVRACDNAHRLEVTIDRWSDFEEWFYSYVIGT